MHEVEQIALDSINKNAKSFSLAASFFPNDLRNSAAQIYFWCRYCDDVIDEEQGTIEDLDRLRLQTHKTWDPGNESLELPFMALRNVAKKTNMPSHYALELLHGMQMDLEGKLYQTIDELKLYCYRVASTVGLMMCHVMGLFKTSALEEAALLGMAMQLTNIARDVKTDFEMGRTYLPLEWLREEKLDQQNYFQSENRAKLYKVVVRLILESEELYKKSIQGIRHLPLRAALPVLIAAKIYRQIGREILLNGKDSLEVRTVVHPLKKFYILLLCFLEIMAQLPARFFSSPQKVKINQTWTYP